MKPTVFAEDFNMKDILKSIYNFIVALTEASYAAHLSRNGQHTRAKDLYK